MKFDKKISLYHIVGIVVVVFALLGFVRVEANRIDTLEYQAETSSTLLNKIDIRLERIDRKLDIISEELSFQRGRSAK